MRVITFNANGIRSAADKGFFRWLAAQDADVICLQETRARIHQLSDDHFFPPGYHCHYFDAQRPGYAGTAIFSRIEPDHVQKGLGWEPIDSEGRWIQADYKDISVVSLYMPSGSSGEERQAIKFALMDRLMPHLEELVGYEPPSLHYVDHIPEHMRWTTWTVQRDRGLESLIVDKVLAARRYYRKVLNDFDRTHQLPGASAPAAPAVSAPTPAASPAPTVAPGAIPAPAF